MRNARKTPSKDLTYQYGVDAQLEAIVDALDPNKSKFIAYDNLNRLIQVAEGAPGDVALPVEDYAYDEEGNRTVSHLSALYASNGKRRLQVAYHEMDAKPGSLEPAAWRVVAREGEGFVKEAGEYVCL